MTKPIRPLEMDVTLNIRLRQAIREFNAARNSFDRALAELQALQPQDVVVLHRCQGESDSPESLYWSYWNRDGRQSMGVEEGVAVEGFKVLIIAAPRPKAEFLPRLPE